MIQFPEYGNIACFEHAALGNDSINLSPEQLATLLPGWPMMIQSSWSSIEAKPKWHAIIETDAAIDSDGYKAVTTVLAMAARRTMKRPPCDLLSRC
jgi:hypothetical protein